MCWIESSNADILNLPKIALGILIFGSFNVTSSSVVFHVEPNVFKYMMHPITYSYIFCLVFFFCVWEVLSSKAFRVCLFFFALL